MDSFYSYNWPGNVRELRNLVERIAILGQDNMEKIENIIYNTFNPSLNIDKNKSISTELTLKEARDNFEKEYLVKQLKKMMVMFLKQLSLLAWIEQRFIENYPL